MSEADIMPGMVIPGMPGPIEASGTGAPQPVNHPDIFAISGACAAWICVASIFTSALRAFDAAIVAISIA